MSSDVSSQLPNLTEMTKENFEDLIDNSKILIIDFWAPWCGPCRQFAPIFEEFASKNPDLQFAKLNTEAQPEIASSFGIMSIPTVGIFKEQHLLFLEAGLLPEEALEQITTQVRNVDMEEVKKEMEKASKN